jgi:hypothetical protein
MFFLWHSVALGSTEPLDSHDKYDSHLLDVQIQRQDVKNVPYKFSEVLTFKVSVWQTQPIDETTLWFPGKGKPRMSRRFPIVAGDIGPEVRIVSQLPSLRL